LARNRLGHRLDDKPYEPRGRDGRAEDVAPIGYRALGDNDHSLSEHVRDTAIAIVDLLQLPELGVRGLKRVIAQRRKPELEVFWVHLDVDVLDDTRGVASIRNVL